MRANARFCSSGVVKPALQYSVLDDIDATLQIELTHGVRLVRLDRLDADRHLRRDLLVAVSRRNQPQHQRLALAQRLAGFVDPLPVATPEESSGHLPREGGIQVLATSRRGANGLKQFSGGALFEHVA